MDKLWSPIWGSVVQFPAPIVTVWKYINPKLPLMARPFYIMNVVLTIVLTLSICNTFTLSVFKTGYVIILKVS